MNASTLMIAGLHACSHSSMHEWTYGANTHAHACMHAACVHACTNAHVHACTHASNSACTHERIHASTHARMHTCTHARTHIQTSMHACTHGATVWKTNHLFQKRRNCFHTEIVFLKRIMCSSNERIFFSTNEFVSQAHDLVSETNGVWCAH